MATIYDVAAEAGVSIKTVSRVLNAEAHVRPALKSRVEAAIELLGYSPSRSARSLAGSSSLLIAAFIDARMTIEHLKNGRGNDYLSRLELGALMECRTAGRHLMVEMLDHDSPHLARDLSALVRALRLEGVLLTPPSSEHPIVLGVLADSATPFVRIGALAETGPGRRVFMDERGAVYDTTRHLLDLGHRDLAYVGGPATFGISSLRRHGYEDAMRDAGLPLRPERTTDGDFTFESGVRAAEVLLSGQDRPTGVVAANDDIALGVLHVAYRMGLDPPRGLSVVGLDDNPIAQFSIPALTTVRQPVAEMASAATRMLLDHGSGDVEVPYALMIRDSTAPPRG